MKIFDPNSLIMVQSRGRDGLTFKNVEDSYEKDIFGFGNTWNCNFTNYFNGGYLMRFLFLITPVI